MSRRNKEKRAAKLAAKQRAEAAPPPPPVEVPEPPPERAASSPAKRFWVTLLAIFVAALAARFAHLTAFADSPFAQLPTLDAAHYDTWAKEIAGGDWFGDEVFLAMPGYPYFVGTIYSLFGSETIQPALVVQCLLGALTAALIFVLGLRLVSYRVGLLAGGAAVLYAPFLFTGAQLLSENLTLLVNTLVLLAAAGSLQQKPKQLLALGLLLGVAALCRVQILLFAALWFGALAWQHAARWKAAGALALGVALVVLPVTIRNWAICGDPVLISANGGINFFIGNNNQANGLYSPPPFLQGGRAEMYAAARTEAVERSGGELSPGGVDSYWYGEGMDWIAGHPGAWLGGLWTKFAYFWNGFEVPDILDYYDARQYSGWLSVPIDFYLVGILGFAGLFLAWQRRRDLLPLYLYVDSQIVFVLIFFMSARFRLLAVPALLVFAAHAGAWLFDKLRAQEWKPLGGAAAALVVGLLLSTSSLPMVTDKGFSPAEKLTNDARALLLSGKTSEAERALRQAIEAKPSFGAAHFLLGTVLEGRGQFDQAMQSYAAAAADPRVAFDAYHKAGVVCLNHYGDPVQAEQLFRAAVQTNDRDAVALKNLGLALYSQRKFEEARQTFANAKQLDPSIQTPAIPQ